MRPVQAAIIATVALCSADSAQRSSSTGIAPVGCSYMWRPSSSWCKPCEAVPLRLRGGGKGGRAEAGRCGQGMTVTTFESDASNPSGAEEMQTVTNAGFGTLEFGNFLHEGRRVGFMYEKGKTGEGALMLSRNPVPAIEVHGGGRREVYFEPGRKGKWKAVPVPKGMTKQQLLTKTKKEAEFLATLPMDEQADFASQRLNLQSELEGSGVRVKEQRGLEKKLRKRGKEKERARARWEARQDEQREAKETRDRKRLENLKKRAEQRKSGGGRKPDGLTKNRKTAVGGVRRQRRTGRKGNFKRRRSH